MVQSENWFWVGEEGGGTLPQVHFHYRVGLGPHLYRNKNSPNLRGGLLGMSLGRYDGRGRPEAFSAELVRECSRCRYAGVVCGFPGAYRPDLEELVEQAARICQRRGMRCFVPEAYGGRPGTEVLISTAVSGGSLEGRLRQAAERFGPERVALWPERAAEDFTLPSHTGCGEKLTQAELVTLREQHPSPCFFSDALCARYFTYMAGEEGHFVLFDDLASLEKKLALGRQLGIGTVFLSPELGELREQLCK